MGRIYQQTVIDTYAKVAFAKLYDRKTPITAAEILNDRVVPFYDEHGIRLCRVLTDRGTEFCGRESHEYELYLAVEDIDHSRTKTKSPQTNGICERFHRTVLDEFYRVAFRKKIYRTIDELQADLDAWLVDYNERRPHQGRWCFGKTPMQTFVDALPLAKGETTSPIDFVIINSNALDWPSVCSCPLGNLEENNGRLTDVTTQAGSPSSRLDSCGGSSVRAIPVS